MLEMDLVMSNLFSKEFIRLWYLQVKKKVNNNYQFLRGVSHE